MHKISKKLKATIKYIIVAFIFSILILTLANIILSKQIKQINKKIDLISIKTTKKILKDIKIDISKNKLTTYPSYGTQYAKLIIPSIEVDLPIYYGDEDEFLLYGVGHTAGTFFPGEGGSILYMAHNTPNMLRRLPETKLGDEIKVETIYGTYNYKIYDAKVIEETDMDAVPLQEEKELLMIYTCYPVTALTHTIYRYIIYAERA